MLCSEPPGKPMLVSALPQCESAIHTHAKLLQSCLTLCDPIDGSPPGSPRPWDFPSRNTGVGCHFLLQCMKVKSENEVPRSCLTLRDLMDCSLPGSSVHGFSRQEYWSRVPLPSPYIRIHTSPLFLIYFPFRSPQNTEWSSLCYTVGSH